MHIIIIAFLILGLYFTFLLKFIILFYSIVTFINLFAFFPFLLPTGIYLDKFRELLYLPGLRAPATYKQYTCKR